MGLGGDPVPLGSGRLSHLIEGTIKCCIAVYGEWSVFQLGECAIASRRYTGS
jgi:hypothetical protein